jgi:hypothetical protein
MAMFSGSALAQNNSKYKTFDFLDFDIKLLTEYKTNPENVDYLKSVIAKELEARGLQQSKNPDLAVNIGVVIEEETQTRETDYRDMRYMGERNYHWEVEEVVVGVYKVGTVSVEMIDTKSDNAVWEESSSNVLRKQKNVRKRIDKGVTRIFKKFDVNKLGS